MKIAMFSHCATLLRLWLESRPLPVWCSLICSLTLTLKPWSLPWQCRVRIPSVSQKKHSHFSYLLFFFFLFFFLSKAIPNHRVTLDTLTKIKELRQRNDACMVLCVKTQVNEGPLQMINRIRIWKKTPSTEISFCT